MTEPSRLGPEDVLAGLTGRRVSAALYAIESRAGLLALADRHAVAPAICEGMVATAERDYMAALAAGEELPSPPRVQHLERSAEAWAHLVPKAPSTRADLARAFAFRYPARRKDVPRIRAALGFEDPTVREAHIERHGVAPDDLWQERLPLTQRLRWALTRATSRLEDLPPFWSAFALTLTQTVGAGILALPLATAGIGPVAGVVVIVVLGLANVLTVAAVAEAVARTGQVRWAGAYLGGVVREHLGRYAAWLGEVGLAAVAIASLVAYYIGLAITLEDSLALPAPVWVAALFAATMAFARRRQFGATIVSALLVGAVNLAIILLLVAASLTSFEASRLTVTATPGPGGGFDPALLGLVFGVILMSYSGHTAVAAGARTILRRDPGGRSLVRGTAAAMVVVMLLYVVWNLAVGAAVDGSRLGSEQGTALTPIAESVGPFVLVLGTIFAVSAMGMAAVHASVGLFNQTAELLRSVRGGHRWDRVGATLALVVVFLFVETLLLTGRASFTAALGYVGTLAIPLVAGVVPVLLVAAARRRGDYVPEIALPRFSGPPMLVLVYLLFLGAVAAHGAVIWSGALERALALGVTAVAVAVTIQVLRSGAFRPLTTLEVRRDRDLGLTTVHVTTGGSPGRAQVAVTGADGESTTPLEGSVRLPERTQAATLSDLPGGTAALQVWAHEVDPWGASVPLPARVTVDDQALEMANGRATVPLQPDAQPTITIGGLR